MANIDRENLVVGSVEVPLDIAAEWIREYTDATSNEDGPLPYAFPAYDRFDTDRNDPLRISDSDLMAPLLLNVAPRLRSYYALQRVRGRLEEGLANPDLSLPLANLDDPIRIRTIVKSLYGVLDDSSRPWGVRGTLLSKVLHRKRPESLILHDTWVNACYVGNGKRVPLARARSWSDYMTALSVAVSEDIRTQEASFQWLDSQSHYPGELSFVRLLDIVAWRSRGRSV